VDRGSVYTDPDVQHCGACKTTARFEFHGDTKHCTHCGQEYPYEEYERGQREGSVNPSIDWPEGSAFYPCNACEQETEHNPNVYGQRECVICGDVLDEDTL
jgi:uncharacterized CHY-type Zn-finger protein